MGAKTLSDVLKKCSKCKVEKPVEDFQTYSGYKMSWCRECKSAKSKEDWEKLRYYSWWEDDIDG